MALVPLSMGRCPMCGAPVRVESWDQPALVRHGGHGGTTRFRVRWCACGWSLPADQSTIAPLRLA